MRVEEIRSKFQPSQKVEVKQNFFYFLKRIKGEHAYLTLVTLSSYILHKNKENKRRMSLLYY